MIPSANKHAAKVKPLQDIPEAPTDVLTLDSKIRAPRKLLDLANAL